MTHDDKTTMLMYDEADDDDDHDNNDVYDPEYDDLDEGRWMVKVGRRTMDDMYKYVLLLMISHGL